jgi:hypothetical protein
MENQRPGKVRILLDFFNPKEWHPCAKKLLMVSAGPDNTNIIFQLLSNQ